MNRYRSIKFKILLPLFISLASVFIIFQIYSNYLLYQESKASRLQHIQILSTAIASNIQASIVFEDTDAAAEQLNAFHADKEIINVRLKLMDGIVFSEYKRDKDTAIVFSDAITHIGSGYFYNSDYLHVFKPITLDNQEIGLLHVISKDQLLTKHIQKAMKSAFLLALLVLFISFYLYRQLNQLIVKPVANLKQSMSNFLEHKRQSQSLQIIQHDELGDLVTGFNTMLDRLASRENKISSTLESLKQQKLFAEGLIESVQHGLFLVDNYGIILSCNACAKALFNNIVEKQTNICDFFDNAAQPALILAIKEVENLQSKTLIINKNAPTEMVLSVSSVTQNNSGSVLFSIDDITERYHANYRQRLAARIFENSQDAILVINTKGIITMNNPALVSLLGIKNRNILGQRPEDTLNWQSIGLHMPTIMQSVDQIGMWQGELWEKDTHDQQIPLFVKAHKIDLQNDSDHADLVLIISDIRNVKEVERLDYLAHHDPLTGLGNRSKLYNFLEDLITNNQQGFFSLIFLDLDGFKAINDNHGHDAGDEVLKVVAKRLPKLIRDEDQAFRLAGDEFVIVMLSGDTKVTDKLSQRVLDLISQPISFADKHLKVGVSVGVHVTEVDETPTITSLLKDADIAMYQAKSQGKGRVIYSVKEK